MKLKLQLLSYDIKSGKRDIIRVLLFTVGLLVLGAVYFAGRVMAVENQSVAVYDVLLYLVRGTKTLNEAEKFEIPIMYMGLAIVCSYATGACMSQKDNYNIVVRINTRRDWVVSKMLLSIITILLLYLSAVLVALIFGGGNMTMSENIVLLFLQCDYCKLDTSNLLQVFAVMFLVPVLTSIAIAQIQMLVSLCAGSIAGFITSLVIYILSIFGTNVLLIGNGCMVQRSKYFTNGGYDVWLYVIADLVVMAVAMVAQLVVAKRKEVW